MRNYGLVTSLGELVDLCNRLAEGDGPIGFDIETGYLGPDREKFSVHAETAMVVGISVTDSVDWARYIPLNHDNYDNVDERTAAELLWPILHSGRGVAHNASFELRHLSRWFARLLADHPLLGGQVRATRGYYPVRSDTQVEAYLAAEYPSFGLKYLVKQVFGHEMTELYELFPDLPVNRRKYLRFNVLDPADPKVYEYACEDALWALALHRRYHPQVAQMPLYAVEMAVITECIVDMEDFGVRYDWPAMRRTADELRLFRDRYNAEIMAELSALLDRPVAINLASPPQVARLLFDDLGLRTSVYTSTTRDRPAAERKMSTGKTALAGLAKQHPVVQKIRTWKELTRLLSTYLDKYERLYQWSDDGMTHPNHMSAVVITGRFAVSDPPYQQCGVGSLQVVTPSGWVRLDELHDGVPVMQYRRDGGLEFVVPEVIRQPYLGDMIEFDSAEGGRWTWTPNHRIVYRSRTARGARALTDIRECTAEEWEARLLQAKPGYLGRRRLHDRCFPKAGRRVGGRTLSPAERVCLRLAIACQADGHLRGARYQIDVYVDRKVTALAEMRVPTEVADHDSVVRGRVYAGRRRHRAFVAAALVSEWLDETPEKNFRAEAILALCADDLRWFVNEVMQWDGDATRGCTYGQKTTRRASVDIVQAAAALCGYATSIYERPEYDAVSVNLWDRDHKEAGWQHVSRVPSDGMVYCVTVPTGMFLCRNDEGKVLITGNSPKEYHVDLAEGAAAHARHAEEHGKDCNCDVPGSAFCAPPGTCFKINFRDFIIAPDEHYIIGFDFSQQELRAIAGEAREPELLRAFDEGRDVHTLTASLMLGVPLDQVTKEQRNIGKTLGFALLYGMSAKGLADRLGIPIEEAEQLFNAYFRVFSRIKAWVDKQVAFGRKHGYVVSKFGRRLPIWEYQSDKRWIQQKGDRTCVNYPIQGSATGDAVKIAMVRAVRALKKAGLHDRVHLVMNVHDALEFYVHRSLEPAQVISVLQPAVVFPVPGWPALKADWHFGLRWGSPVEITVTDTGGTVRVQIDSREPELKPGVEVDEDTGEEVEIMPSDAAEHIQTARQQADKAGRHLLVELDAMPTLDGYQRFLELVTMTPGRHRVTIRTSDGDLDLDHRTALTPDHLAPVSMLLGPARLYWDDADTLDQVLDGVTLDGVSSV